MRWLMCVVDVSAGRDGWDFLLRMGGGPYSASPTPAPGSWNISGWRYSSSSSSSAVAGEEDIGPSTAGSSSARSSAFLSGLCLVT